MNQAYLSLGSNIRPDLHLPAAVRALDQIGRVVAVSRVWQSAPVGDERQADFCNAALLLETEYGADDLLGEQGVLRKVEADLGRVRDPGNKNAARTIDIDLSLFNQERLKLGSHRVPDPEILERPFVSLPLAEIAPDYRHPENGLRLREIAANAGVARLQARDDIDLRRAVTPYRGGK